jgi:hypothetical protein
MPPRPKDEEDLVGLLKSVLKELRAIRQALTRPESGGGFTPTAPGEPPAGSEEARYGFNFQPPESTAEFRGVSRARAEGTARDRRSRNGGGGS